MSYQKERCVLTLPLITEPFQDVIIQKRFEIMEHLQNSLIALELRKLKNLERTRAYREVCEKIRVAPDRDKKVLSKQRGQMLKDAGFFEYRFQDDITPMQKHFVEHIFVHEAHRAAQDVWRAFEKYLFGSGKAIHFKRRGTLSSIANKTSGMYLKDGWFYWNGGRSKQAIPLKIRVAPPNSTYESEMLKLPVCYFRVVRKWMTSRYRYYLQITLKGKPVSKNRPVVEGRVGIDIGTQSIAIASLNSVRLLELADHVNQNHTRIQYLQKKMDRSRRATNPGNFCSDGTIRRGIKLTWNYSNHYQKLAGEIRMLQRKNADIRKYQHYCLANDVLALGNEVYVETMNFRALQRRARETTVNERGRFNCKKRFGKSLANKAPAMFILFLEKKLEASGGKLHRVNTSAFKASQYDHVSQKYSKKMLSQRMHRLPNGDLVQRDMYSAFLLMNAACTLQAPDQMLCERTYSTFKYFHDIELMRIQNDGKHHLSSFGIA